MWTQHIWAFGELFTNDTKARGMYISSMTFQKLNDGGMAAKTHVLNDDGTKSFFESGVVSAIPGAPEEFIKERAEKNTLLGEAASNSSAQVIIGNDFRPEMIPSAPKKTGGTNSTSKCLARLS